jgi:MFS family permease
MTDPAPAEAPTGYLSFARENARFLSFGFLMALASSFGQTFFIGVFGPEIQAEFDLSHAEWGTVYMLGTLLSALVLPFTGRWIDRMPLLRYAALVSVGLAVACLGAALCPGAGFLVAAIFMLRHMGQGLASHTSITSTVKYFRFSRGKAVAIVSLGYPAGRAVLPVVAVALIAFVGWRETYAIAGFIALVLVLAIAQQPPNIAARTSAPIGYGAEAGTGRAKPDRIRSVSTPLLLRDLARRSCAVDY